MRIRDALLLDDGRMLVADVGTGEVLLIDDPEAAFTVAGTASFPGVFALDVVHCQGGGCLGLEYAVRSPADDQAPQIVGRWSPSSPARHWGSSGIRFALGRKSLPVQAWSIVGSGRTRRLGGAAPAGQAVRRGI